MIRGLLTILPILLIGLLGGETTPTTILLALRNTMPLTTGQKSQKRARLSHTTGNLNEENKIVHLRYLPRPPLHPRGPPDDEHTETDATYTPADKVPLPKVVGAKPDWGKSVKKAKADSSRCRAPCELLPDERVHLIEDVDETLLNEFRVTLKTQCPRAPNHCHENLISILGKAGKLQVAQASLATTFKITNLGKRGLFIPTGFQKKAPFGGSAGYNLLPDAWWT